METIKALWDFHKENIILTMIAGVIILTYEVGSHFLRRWLKSKYP